LINSQKSILAGLLGALDAFGMTTAHVFVGLNKEYNKIQQH